MNKYDSGVENVFITLADHDGLFEAGESLSGKEMFKYISNTYLIIWRRYVQ